MLKRGTENLPLFVAALESWTLERSWIEY